MKTTEHNTNLYLDSFDFISNELQEEFTNVFNSLGDAIVID
ncbi:hypothetical protein [Lacinutrix sp.]|nr:hypothetical protein [Lacinutrix sp.]